MKLLANLKIRRKLLLGFGIVILLTLFMAAFSFSQLNEVNDTYTNVLNGTVTRSVSILNISRNYARFRRIAATASSVSCGDAAALNKLEEEYNALKTANEQYFNDYFKSLDDDEDMDAAGKESRRNLVNGLKSRINTDYEAAIRSIFTYARADDQESAEVALLGAASMASDINDTIDSILASARNTRISMADDAFTSAKTAEFMTLVFLAGVIAAAVICALAIAGGISKGVISITDSAKKIAEGDFNVEIGSNNRDELGELSNTMLHLKDTVQSLVRDIEHLTAETAAGEVEARIDINAYKGEFRSVADGVNGIVGGFCDDILNSIETVMAFGNGNFDVEIKKLPGKKILMTDSFKSVQASLKGFNSDIQNIIRNASAGNLDASIDTKRYAGDWGKMAEGVNALLNAIVIPIREAVEVLNKLSEGDLDVSVKGAYQGEFEVMKSSLNNTIRMLTSYIKEISSILVAMSRDNLNQSVDREYVGQFSEIKEALNIIITKFNAVISEISSAAQQVASGAKQMSDSSSVLAQGAVQQSASIEEVNTTITIINENTRQNALNAKEADELSDRSKEHADKGNQYMNDLLVSIGNIENSSNSISKIIRVIEDIAFQTNLLALNAAVEAARAGEHGNGFAIVAEEVRNLASRSQDSAKETAALIEESLLRVNEGTRIAGQTAEALKKIVGDVTAVANIITGIASSSIEQATAIEQISDGISQISGVVQNNSATSEEAAAAAEELSSQSEVLLNSVKVFKLKK